MSATALLSMLLSVAQPATNDPLRRAESALAAALGYDAAAYGQICGREDKVETFLQMQAAARALQDELGRRLGAIIIRYVDRRGRNACYAPERFDQTVAEWQAALRRVEHLLEAQR